MYMAFVHWKVVGRPRTKASACLPTIIIPIVFSGSVIAHTWRTRPLFGLPIDWSWRGRVRGGTQTEQSVCVHSQIVRIRDLCCFTPFDIHCICKTSSFWSWTRVLWRKYSTFEGLKNSSWCTQSFGAHLLMIFVVSSDISPDVVVAKRDNILA